MHVSGVHNITHRHTTSHIVTQHHTRSHNITHCHTTSHIVTQHHTTSHNVTKHHTSSHNITQHHTTSHIVTQHHTTSQNVTHRHTVSYQLLLIVLTGNMKVNRMYTHTMAHHRGFHLEGTLLLIVDPLSYFSFQPVLHDWPWYVLSPLWDGAYKTSLAANRKK